MAIVNLGLSSFFTKSKYAHTDLRWKALASYLTRRLAKAVDDLSDLGLYFEAEEAQSLQQRFQDFYDIDGDTEQFVNLWNDLVDWAGSAVDGKNTLLCKIPNLPDEYSV